MSVSYTELLEAANEVLSTVSQPDAFKRQLTKLIANAVTDNVVDSDVKDVVAQARVSLGDQDEAPHDAN